MDWQDECATDVNGFANEYTAIVLKGMLVMAFLSKDGGDYSGRTMDKES